MAYRKTDNSGYEKLIQQLREKSLGNFYVFKGEEAFLRTYYFNMVKKLLLDETTADFNYHSFSAENLSAEAVYDAVEALPMMAERSLVHIDDVDFYKLPESDREKFSDIFSDIPPYCTVILTYETTPFKQDKRMKTLTQALNQAVIVDFCKRSERELSDWVARHVRAEGKTISAQLCDELVQRTGGMMTTLQSEISKLCAYADGTQITKADMEAVVEPVLDAAIFDLSDTLADGRYEQALKKLRTLLQMQEEPIVILAALSTQFRRILTAQTLLAAGKGRGEMMQLCGIAEYPAKKAMEYARKLPEQTCVRAMELCAQADWNLKNSRGEPERVVELVILQLAQEADHA